MINVLREAADDMQEQSSHGAEDFPQLTENQALRLASMLKNHFDSTWRVGRRMGLSSAEAEENAQEAFAVAARKLGIIWQGREREFLLGVAVRLASNTRRRLSTRMERLSNNQNEQEVRDNLPHAEELVVRKQQRDVLDQILQSMSVVFREVLTLYEIEGLTLPEIAEALEIPEGTATSRLRRARVNFCEKLERVKKHNARLREGT